MRNRKSHFLTAALFPAVLFYYEILFQLSTGHRIMETGTAIMALICTILGLLFYLICTASPWKSLNRVLSAVLLAAVAVAFLVEYFVYRQFKIFYDLNTVFGGAADAVSDFSADIYRMVFSWDGASKIVLFLLPSVLLLIFGKGMKVPAKVRWRGRVVAALLAVLLAGLGAIGVSSSKSMSMLVGSQYNFQKAVDAFGLIGGVGLDVKSLSGGSGGFENVPTIPTIPTVPTTPAPTDPNPSQAETTPAPTDPPVVYVPNQLDIDFSGLTTQGRLGELSEYVSILEPSMTNEYTGLFEGKNLILITAEAFCHAAIHPELTPTLYRMATQGIQFTDYYQPSGAGTTGGEYQVLFGMLATNGGQSFKDTDDNNNYFTMGSQLNRLGYWGKAYHNHTYTYYDRHKTHKNLGYSQGFMGMGNGMEEYVKKQWPESDMEMFQGTLWEYIDQQPFNVYYMTVSGHGGYSVTGNSMVKKNWDRVKDLEYSDPVKGYFATQLELEDAMTYLIGQLEAAGIADDTVICITGDHFPYGLDDDVALTYLSELYGMEVTNSMERDKSALIIWSGCLEDMEPIVVDTPTSSLDILPTLSNLFGTAYDSRLFPGRDVFSDEEPLVFNFAYEWKTVYGTYVDDTFIPASEDIQIPEEYVEVISAVVRNKIRYCDGVLDRDYFGYLYEEGQLP